MGFSQIIPLKNLHYLQIMRVFSEKPNLSERNPHYLCAQVMWVYLKNSLYLRAHPFTKEHSRSQDDLKMRLEKPILFRHADEDRFSDRVDFSEKTPHYLQIKKATLSEKPTLSADNVGFFFQKNPLYLRETHIICR